MKKIQIYLLVLILGFVIFGYYQKMNQQNGDKWIGIGILLLTFVWIPLFLYGRLKNKETRERMFFGTKKNKENL